MDNARAFQLVLTQGYPQRMRGSVTFCLAQVRLVHFRLVHFRLAQVRLDNILPR